MHEVFSMVCLTS